MKIKFLAALIVTTLCCLSASAQRTMDRQNSLCLQALWTGSSFGAEAFFSRYSLIGFWQTGIGAKQYNAPTNAGVSLNSLHIVAEGDYLFRLVGTRNRSVNLYGGAGVFLGYEAIDPLHRLPSDLQPDLAKGYFLYGIQAKILSEFFMSKSFALTLEGCVPVNFGSLIGKFHYDAGIGIKVML